MSTAPIQHGAALVHGASKIIVDAVVPVHSVRLDHHPPGRFTDQRIHKLIHCRDFLGSLRRGTAWTNADLRSK